MMGTLLEITLYGSDCTRAREVMNESFLIAQKLDELLSNYKADSELSKLNSSPPETSVKVSKELLSFLEISKSLSESTKGYFDIAVGPLLTLWAEAQKKRALPNADEILSTRAKSSSRDLNITDDQAVSLLKAGMHLDSGGVGKGYAVDKIVAHLRSSGIKNALINFGRSSVYGLGAPPGESKWKLLIQFEDEAPLGDVWLNDQGFSGSYSHGRSFEIAGRKFGHIVNPHDGYLITEPAKALVVATSAVVAEAASKMVLLSGVPEVDARKTLGIVWATRIGH